MFDLALLWTSMSKNGWPPKEPQLTDVYFMMKLAICFKQKPAGIFWPRQPGHGFVTFENGRWTLGIALPASWAPLYISRLPARKSTTRGSSWRYGLPW